MCRTFVMHLLSKSPTDGATMNGLTKAQYDTLVRPLNSTRVAKRSQGGKQLSYLESWDVRAHLIRCFGYANWDEEVLGYEYVREREYMSKGDPEKGKEPIEMVEVIYSAQVRLTIRDVNGHRLCRYTEGAVGSASGPLTMMGEHHDNALKTAASDALKRCAMNLGNQFGLSLYDSGSTRDVVKGTIVRPESDTVVVPLADGTVLSSATESDLTEEQAARLAASLGATIVSDSTPEPSGEAGSGTVPGEDSSPSTEKAAS